MIPFVPQLLLYIDMFNNSPTQTYQVYPIKTVSGSWINYAYLVVDSASRNACIIDPAWELEKITHQLDLVQGNLKAILLTHSHSDHVDLVEPLIEKFNPLVFMSKMEIDFYQYSCRNLNALPDKGALNIGNTEIIGLLTPGHTVGSMCYLLSNSIFTGDTIFAEGCGVCDEYGGSLDSMFSSIQRIKTEVPSHIHVYPGHSYGKIPGQALYTLLKENIYFQIEKKQHFINFRTRKNQTGIFDFK